MLKGPDDTAAAQVRRFCVCCVFVSTRGCGKKNDGGGREAGFLPNNLPKTVVLK